MKFRVKVSPNPETVEVVANRFELQAIYVAVLYDELHPKDIPTQALINENGEWELRSFSFGTEDVSHYRIATEKEKKIREAIVAIEEANNKLNKLSISYRETENVKEN